MCSSDLEGALAADTIVGQFLWNEIDDTQTPNWQNIANSQGLGWSEIDDTQVPNWQNITNTQGLGWSEISDVQTPNWQEIVT